jgi:DNA-binding response OmpR family regulator
MASVRKKIEPDPSDPTYIETVYGIGYRFDDE